MLPLSAMCCAAWACEESTSSISGGVKSEANCTARKMAVNSSQVAPAEGADGGRWRVVVRYVVAEDGIRTRIPAGPGTDFRGQVTDDSNRLTARRALRPGAGPLVPAQGSRLLPRGLRAGAFCHVGVNGAGHAGIDEPLKLRRMAIEVDAGDGTFPHADGGSAIGRDQAA